MSLMRLLIGCLKISSLQGIRGCGSKTENNSMPELDWPTLVTALIAFSITGAVFGAFVLALLNGDYSYLRTLSKPLPVGIMSVGVLVMILVRRMTQGELTREDESNNDDE